MPTSKIAVTAGTGTNVATHTITEDTETRHLYRLVPSSSNGTEIGTNANPIQVGDGGASLTVDGAITANQGGTWNITNISGTVALPTGAATLAEQQTQTTALQLIDDAIATDNSSAQTKLMQVGGTDGTNAQILSVNSSGHVNIADGGNTITVDGTVAATQSGTWNVTNISGTVSLPTGAATSANQATLIGHVDGIEGLLGTIDADTSALAGAVSGSEVQVDVITMPTTNVAQSGTWTVQPGNTANTTPWLVSQRPATSGGLTVYRNIDVDETDVQVKGSAGQLYGYYLHNNSSATIFLKFYNALSSDVTVGTTTPFLTIPIPAFSSANADFSHGIAFSTGITIACTGGLADNDTTALGANECIVNLFYS